MKTSTTLNSQNIERHICVTLKITYRNHNLSNSNNNPNHHHRKQKPSPLHILKNFSVINNAWPNHHHHHHHCKQKPSPLHILKNFSVINNAWPKPQQPPPPELLKKKQQTKTSKLFKRPLNRSMMMNTKRNLQGIAYDAGILLKMCRPPWNSSQLRNPLNTSRKCANFTKGLPARYHRNWVLL
eukprot:PhF_6_TR27970/c0_g1_i5/m.41352